MFYFEGAFVFAPGQCPHLNVTSAVKNVVVDTPIILFIYLLTPNIRSLAAGAGVYW